MTMVRADERLANLGVVYNSKITPRNSKEKVPSYPLSVVTNKLSSNNDLSHWYSMFQMGLNLQCLPLSLEVAGLSPICSVLFQSERP